MTEKLANQTSETIDQNSIDQAIDAAATRVSELGFESEFQAYLADSHIPLDTKNPEEYWGAVAGYMDTVIGKEDLSPLERDSLATVAYLPLALTHGYYLDLHKDQLDYHQKRTARENVSAYNALLKHFVTSYPQRSDSLEQSLLGATLQTMGGDTFTEFAEQKIKNILRGVKHEVGFGKILEAIGVPYREATTEEDLKGKDYVVTYKGKEIGIDVKASLDQIDGENRGANGAIAHKRNGDIIMLSCLLDSDFSGSFEPNPDRINEIWPTAGALLQQALNQTIAKY